MLVWTFPAERQVDALPSQTNVRLSYEAAASLVQSGSYERATGLMAGVHYRKARGNGCYHLRIHEGSAYLHWEKWDPRRFPVRHFLESPALALPALGLVALVLLGRASKD